MNGFTDFMYHRIENKIAEDLLDLEEGKSRSFTFAFIVLHIDINIIYFNEETTQTSKEKWWWVPTS